VNAETELHRRPICLRSAVRAAALIALCALAPVAALADSPAVSAENTRVARVSLAGIDLSTPEGARTAYNRLKIVAQRLCLQLGDNRKISYQATYFACVRETLADAVRHINAPAIAAVEKSRIEY